jgi:16S rRNA (adenine1518-N6/adenine1519-N6)-dimethyltransferase
VVKPKKKLGQHFLKDQNVANNIIDCLSDAAKELPLLEIGPGTGVLTKRLLPEWKEGFKMVEVDGESVAYLLKTLKVPASQVIEADFLQMNLKELYPAKFNIIGNFPYNISSQIYFKVLEYRDQVDEVVGMIQKEVAERIAASPGGRTGGILSILIQAFYDVKYEFTVPPEVFDPPPRVQSGVLTLKRNNTEKLDCDEKLFFRVVKQGFHNRRKTLRNALKSLGFDKELLQDDIFGQRAEQLSVAEFVWITNHVSSGVVSQKPLVQSTVK